MGRNINSQYDRLARSLPLQLGGKIFFVGDSSVAGISDIIQMFRVNERYYATIDAAVSACVADRGDIVLVAPGHAEDISSATSLVMDVAGVSVIGIGEGLAKPTLTYTATAGSIEMDAANCTLKNIRLLTSITAVVVGVNVDAAGCKLENVDFDWDVTGDDFLIMVDIDAVNDATVRGCTFVAEDTAGSNEAIRLDDTDNTLIENSSFYGDFTNGCIRGEGATGTNLRIRNNDFYNSDTTAGMSIDLNVAFTGKLSYNSCGTLFAADPETSFDPGSCLCVENYVANAVDESGAIVPITLST